MDRAITGFHLDDLGDWVAELSCGHDQHVRHNPPFQLRPWVVSEAGRSTRLGAPIDCPPCDRAELPTGLRFVRTSPEWTDDSMPAGLRKWHRLAAETWGQITVHEGRLGFTMDIRPALQRELAASAVGQAIPPEVDHEVEPHGPVRFTIDFFVVDRTTTQR